MKPTARTCGDCRFCDTDYHCRCGGTVAEEVDTGFAACSLFERGEPMEATIPDPAIPDGGPCCPACGVPFTQHPGLILTCRALQEARDA